MTHDAQASVRDVCDGMRLAHQVEFQGTAPVSLRWNFILNTLPNSRFLHPSLRPVTGLAAPDTSFVFRVKFHPISTLPQHWVLKLEFWGRETLIYKTSLPSDIPPFFNQPSPQINPPPQPGVPSLLSLLGPLFDHILCRAQSLSVTFFIPSSTSPLGPTPLWI